MPSRTQDSTKPPQRLPSRSPPPRISGGPPPLPPRPRSGTEPMNKIPPPKAPPRPAAKSVSLPRPQYGDMSVSQNLVEKPSSPPPRRIKNGPLPQLPPRPKN